MNETDSVIIVVNPSVPLQPSTNDISWKAKVRRIRQDPPWGSICMCSACFAFSLTLLVMLILNVKEFSQE